MALFNPLLEAQVAQFDAKHGEAVPDDEGTWLIYQDGSSRKVAPSQFDFVEAEDQPVHDTVKWRQFWCRKMIPMLAQRFNRRRGIALSATGADAARELAALQKLHDQLVSVKHSLDDLNNADAPPARLDYVTWYDCRPAGMLEEGRTPISVLELAVRDLRRSCEQLRRDIKYLGSDLLLDDEARSSKSIVTETRLAGRLKLLENATEALRLQREWEAKPLEERQAIARQRLAAIREQSNADLADRRKHVDAVRALSVAFVDDQPGVLTAEEKRHKEESQREADVRKESSQWEASRMSEKEERLERARNKGAEKAARDEFAEAVAEGEAIQSRRGRPPKAKEAKKPARRGRPPKKAKR